MQFVYSAYPIDMIKWNILFQKNMWVEVVERFPDDLV